MRRGIFLVFVLFLVERYGVNESNTAKSSFKRYKPVPKSGLERAWERIIKPVTTLALCFAIGVCSANTAKADEYLWKMRGEAWPEDTAWTFRRIIYFKVDGDTLPCTEETTDSVDTDWVFQTIADTSGHVYYINKRDSIDSEGALWDWVIVQFVGERGTKAELEARYDGVDTSPNGPDFYGDTTSTLWILVEEKEYNIHPPPIKRNFYFYPFFSIYIYNLLFNFFRNPGIISRSPFVEINFYLFCFSRYSKNKKQYK